MSILHDRHGLRLELYKSPHGGLTADPEKASLFQRAADWTSAAMGRPANIMIWLVAVIAWTLTFALGGTHPPGPGLVLPLCRPQQPRSAVRACAPDPACLPAARRCSLQR